MDWKKETSSTFVYPAGTYYVRVVSWERVKASTGTPQIRWTNEIVAPEQHRGRNIFEHTPVTEKSLFCIANFVAACGVDTGNYLPMDTDSFKFDSILNACKERRLYFQVQEATYNGKAKNDIVDYQPDLEQPIVQLSDGEEVAWEDEPKKG